MNYFMLVKFFSISLHLLITGLYIVWVGFCFLMYTGANGGSPEDAWKSYINIGLLGLGTRLLSVPRFLNPVEYTADFLGDFF